MKHGQSNHTRQAIRREIEALRTAKPKPISPGVVTAEVQADRVRRPYTGRLCGNVTREHRAGGAR